MLSLLDPQGLLLVLDCHDSLPYTIVVELIEVGLECQYEWEPLIGQMGWLIHVPLLMGSQRIPLISIFSILLRLCGLMARNVTLWKGVEM